MRARATSLREMSQSGHEKGADMIIAPNEPDSEDGQGNSEHFDMCCWQVNKYGPD